MNTQEEERAEEEEEEDDEGVTVTRRTGWISALVSTTTLASVAFLDIISDRTFFCAKFVRVHLASRPWHALGV